MGNVVSLQNQWLDRCQTDLQHLAIAPDCGVIVQWLLGKDPATKASLPAEAWLLYESGIDYRYRVLKQYLAQPVSQRYGQLLRRLGRIITLRQQIKTWIALSRDRRRTVVDVLEEVVQDMLHRDRYLQEELAWLQHCTAQRPLQEAFLCTTLEEYCLRPIQNQPLISYRFVNLMRRYQRAGMTQAPTDHNLRLLSTELETNHSEYLLNRLDDAAIAQHQSQADLWEQDLLRQAVLDQFRDYLKNNVKDPLILSWLELYLQGYSQEAIAAHLNIPIKKSYRLRDKVKYHAIHNFAIKTHPEVVAAWLQTHLQGDRLGLTPKQWEAFTQALTPEQLQTLVTLQGGTPQQHKGETLHCKSDSPLQKWSKIYLLAQQFRE